MPVLKKPELLSPAGSAESVKAAVNNGCDAIYIGGQKFSARQYADNFDIDEFERICDYCHLRDVNVYATVNTIYKDGELKELFDFVKRLYEIGVDALIVQDLGVANAIRSTYPDLKLHASTQLTANSVKDVLALEKIGFSKVVLSRELNLKEINEIVENCGCEIETFIHGALCVSYSGQCIMSSMLGGRSGNRGRCAQTCRLPYSLHNSYSKIKEGHLLSPKDIETVTILPELIEAGISSLKIEGRMKSPEYVAGVTSIYRKYIDMYFENPDSYNVDENDIKILLQLFNRGGFTEGYYKNFSGSDMMSPERPKSWGVKLGHIDSYDKKSGRTTIRTREPLAAGDGIEIWTRSEPHVGSGINKASKAGEVINVKINGDVNVNDVVYKTHDKALEDLLKQSYQKDIRTKNVYGSFSAYAGNEMKFSLWDNEGNKVSVSGGNVQQAQNQPLSADKIKKQLLKTGGTAFRAVEVEFFGDENIYIPMAELNQIRRDAVDELEKAILKRTKRKTISSIKPLRENAQFKYDKKLNVLVSDILQFRAAIASDGINIIYIELFNDFEENFKKIVDECHEAGIKLYAAIPRIYRKYSADIYEKFIDELKESEIDGFLVRSIGQFHEFKSTGKEIATDFNMNVFNSYDVEFWNDMEADIICVSAELNLNEINDMANEHCEMIGYGHVPLMTTHQCPVGAYAGNKRNGMYCELKDAEKNFYLKDRKGEKFPLLTDCSQCVCTILNGKPLFLLKFFDEILASPTGFMRLMFTTEDAAETKRIINAYAECIADWIDIKPSVKKLISEMTEKGSTKGHYFRGIE